MNDKQPAFNERSTAFAQRQSRQLLSS